MTGKAFDAAYPPNLDAVVAAGGQMMTVYLTGRYAVDAAWCQKVHAKGLGILGNYEEAAGELVTCGRPGGVSAGQRAASAYIADGAPARAGLAIVFSVDVNVQPYQFAAVGTAFDGINIGLAGRFTAKVYGEGALIDYLVANRKVTKLDWLSASTSFPGYNPNDPTVALVQQIGSPVAGTDLDIITQPIDGVWWPNGEAPSGGGIALEAGMSQTEVDAINAHTDQVVGGLGTLLYGNVAHPDPTHPYSLLFLANRVAALAASEDSDHADLAAKIKALTTPSIDPKALAAELAKDLPADEAHKVATELAAIIARGAAS